LSELERRTRVVGVFPSEPSALDLATTVLVRATEDWTFRRYMEMKPLTGFYTKNAT
jgi:transposase-like protein